LEDSRVLKVSQLRDGEADVVRAHAGKVGFYTHQFAGGGRAKDAAVLRR
jgi:hypothetical protein